MLGLARRDQPLPKEAVVEIHNAVKLLREIYEKQGKPQEIERLNTLIKDLPTTATSSSEFKL